MFKRILIILSSVILMLSMLVANNTPIFSQYSNNYEIYLENYSSSQKIINTGSNEFRIILGKKGESVCVEKQNFNLHSFLVELRAQVVFSEQVDGKTSYYALSPKLKYMQRVKGHNINLHVVVGENFVKLGSPIIYGSF